MYHIISHIELPTFGNVFFRNVLLVRHAVDPLGIESSQCRSDCQPHGSELSSDPSVVGSCLQPHESI